MKNKLVSILIPLYNSEEWIAETITSLLEQTHQNIEIIIIDDSSTDNSFQIAKTFSSEKVKVFQQAHKGACAARNKAFEISKGDYIQYIDADDILSPTKIYSQLKLLSNNDNRTIASCGWTKFIKEYKHLKVKPQFINKSYSNPIQWLTDAWSENEMGQTSIWLTPRNLIEKTGGWNETLTVNQDGEFFCRVLLNASGILYHDDVIVYYRIGNPQSITHREKSFEKGESLLKSYKLYENYLKNYLKNVNIKKAVGHNYLKFIYHYNDSHPILVQKAWEHFNNLNVGKPWGVCGRKFSYVVFLFGFNNALKLKNKLNL